MKSEYISDEILSHEEVRKLLEVPDEQLLLDAETHIFEGKFINDEENEDIVACEGGINEVDKVCFVTFILFFLANMDGP